MRIRFWTMSRAFRLLVHFTAVGLVLAMQVSCKEDSTVESDMNRAEEVATLAVGVIAEGNMNDASALFGEPVNEERMRQLQEEIPAGCTADPKRYDAQILGNGPTSALGDAAVRVISREEVDCPDLIVQLRWDEVRGDWRVRGITVEEPIR